jgi:hypothetical protein
MKNSSRILSLICVTFSLFGFQCVKEKEGIGPLLKGKLSVAGWCKNYTITLLEGDLSSRQVENKWTDPETGITYRKAFHLANHCDFPDHITEGDEFYFRVISRGSDSCFTCTGYYPSPAKAIAIRVQ